MDRLENVKTFVKVARSGSFVLAARQLRVAPSVVSTRVLQLERYVGGALFHRTTRSVALSELGAALLRECEELISHEEALLGLARATITSPIGLLRVHAPPGLVLSHFPDLLSQFFIQNPGIRIELDVGNEIVDPIKNGFDCALQLSIPTSEDLIARSLFTVHQVLCASPAYARRFALPATPAELVNHSLALQSNNLTRDRWSFKKDGQEVTVQLCPKLLVNSAHLLAGFAINDCGIASLPAFVASPLVQEGRLVRILAEYQMQEQDMLVVFARTLRSSRNLRAFLALLVNSYLPARPWDVELGLPSEPFRKPS